MQPRDMSETVSGHLVTFISGQTVTPLEHRTPFLFSCVPSK